MPAIQRRLSSNGEISFRVQVRLKGQPPATATFKRLTDAKKWGQTIEAAMIENRYFKHSQARKHTVADMIDRYLEKLARERSPRLRNVTPILNWWKAKLGYAVLSDLSRAKISHCIDDLFCKTVLRVNGETGERELVPISPATINRYTAAFSHVCTTAVNQWEWLESNPMLKIQKLREADGRIRFLSDFEREKLLVECQKSACPYLYLIVVLALSTGARRGEILGICWRDVDLVKGQIVLHKTKNRQRRLLPLRGTALKMMAEHAKIRHLGSEFVFPSPETGRPYEIKRSWQGAVKRADLSDFRFHDLRHSAASYLAMNGASLAEMAEILGHKTLQMVKRYAHLSEAHTGNVVAQMNERIFADV